MEKDISMSEDQFSIKHPIVSYAFAIMEYVKTTDPSLFKRAAEYAEDLTGVHLEDFVLQEVEDDDESEDGENDITDQIIEERSDEDFEELDEE
jgi:hypothetical protein